MLFVVSILSWFSLSLVVLGIEVEQRAACNEDNLLRALQHRTPDSYSFCSGYISQPPTTTVTVTSSSTYTHTSEITYTRHPQNLFNIQHMGLDNAQTPIIYTNKAVPTPVPGNVQDYYGPQYRRDVKLKARATTTLITSSTTTSVPPYLASYPPSRISSGCTCLGVPYSQTVTTTAFTEINVEASPCTYLTESPTTNVPELCAASVQVNAPAVQTGLANVTTVSKFNSPTKADCCYSCTKVFNCIWWKFDFAHPAADGTGDPWSPGKCQYAFYTGFVNDSGIDIPAICPNGVVGAVQGGQSWGSPRLPGYNQGPCGGVPGWAESSQDFDYPPNYDSDNDCR